MNTDLLQQLLSDAESEHEDADGPEETAYWQGRKDGLRVALSILLNDNSYVQLIGTSVYAWQQSVREFEPTQESVNDKQCIECGQQYFHKPGCLHGAGLTTEEFEQRVQGVVNDTV